MFSETRFTPASSVRYPTQYPPYLRPHYNGAIGPQQRLIQPLFNTHDRPVTRQHGYASPPVHVPVSISRSQFVFNKSFTAKKTITQSHNIRVVPGKPSFAETPASCIERVLYDYRDSINALPISAQHRDAEIHKLKQDLSQIAHGVKEQQLPNIDLLNLLSKKVADFSLKLQIQQLQPTPLSEPLHSDMTQGSHPLKRLDSSLSNCSTVASITLTPLAQKKISTSELINRADKKLADSTRSQYLQRKHYPDFQRSFYIDHKTVTDPVRIVPIDNETFRQQEHRIRDTSYNKNCGAIHSPGEYAFFHQRQIGPYCQTVSINNFLGEDLLTPDSLTNLLGLEKKHIGAELGTSGTLELLSRLRIEQRKKIMQLEGNEAALLMSSDKQSIKNANTLLKELNCRACEINQRDKHQIKRFVHAADAAKVNRLHLSFMTKAPFCGHAIALRRDPNDRRLWLVLDGNLAPHRRFLDEILTSYCHEGPMHLIAHKALFKQDPSIAYYQVKQQPEKEEVTLKRHRPEQNSRWYDVSSQQPSHKKYKNPGWIEADFCQWEQRNRARLLCA